MSNYYIVSLKWTRRENPYITFWRPDNSGYACPLSWAGKYSEEKVLYEPYYYNDGKNTIAVLDEVVEALSIPKPSPGEIDGDVGPVIVNSKSNMKALRASRYEYIND